ncbi:uncharacterized protein LOC133730603 [Rosa rugosa]|uniref:uncharacterized protein LOC133730603 n=1 Tax=Rosa rugosa TaxID=74645 RepID=UPI002B412F9C|nr:uncharacterized protein LOC133730603 [Rosa rugosa]
MSKPSKIPSAREIEERLACLQNPPQLEYRRPSPLRFKPYTFNEQGKRILDPSEESTSPTPTPSPPLLTPSPLVSPNLPSPQITPPLSPEPPLSPPPEEEEEEEMGGNANQSIRELSSSVVQGGLPTSIVYPAPAAGRTADFELKSGLLHRLPMFHDLSMEDANKHIREFQSVCTTMQPLGSDENILKMKAFPFSLADRAKDWLYELPPGRITSWDAMMKAFLEKYFLTSKVITLRKKISGIKQAQDESYAAYYESNAP